MKCALFCCGWCIWCNDVCKMLKFIHIWGLVDAKQTQLWLKTWQKSISYERSQLSLSIVCKKKTKKVFHERKPLNTKRTVIVKVKSSFSPPIQRLDIDIEVNTNLYFLLKQNYTSNKKTGSDPPLVVGHQAGVDVSGVPVKQLVTVICRHHPAL